MTLSELPLTNKICSKCKVLKPVSCFAKRSDVKSGLTSHCKQCRKKHSAQHYLANAKQINDRSKKWKIDNPEKKSIADKKYRIKNHEKIKISKKEYNLANANKRREYSSTRRARKLHNGVYVILAKEMRKLYASPCLYCGSKDSIQADHVIPLKKGGIHGIGNLVPACAKCNGSKSDRFLAEWKASKINVFK